MKILPNSDEFASTPEKTVHGNGSDAFFEFLKRGLIIPGFDIENDVWLGDNFTLLLLLGRLALIVSSDTFGLELWRHKSEMYHVIKKQTLMRSASASSSSSSEPKRSTSSSSSSSAAAAEAAEPAGKEPNSALYEAMLFHQRRAFTNSALELN